MVLQLLSRAKADGADVAPGLGTAGAGAQAAGAGIASFVRLAPVAARPAHDRHEHTCRGTQQQRVQDFQFYQSPAGRTVPSCCRLCNTSLCCRGGHRSQGLALCLTCPKGLDCLVTDSPVGSVVCR